MHTLTRSPFGLRQLLAFVFAVSCLGGCGAGPEKRQVDLLIVDGTIIDPASRAITQDALIAIDDGVIVAVGKTDRNSFGARRTIDARGKFLVPAFADMHSHWGSGTFIENEQIVEMTLKRSLYYGVTRVLNMGSNDASPAEIDEFRRNLEEGEWQGPTIYAVGALLSVPGSHPTTTIFPPDMQEQIADMVNAAPEHGPIDLMPLAAITLVRSADDLRTEVKRLASWGADAIKLTIESGPGPFGDNHPQMSEEIVRAAVEEAHRAGVRVIAHISSRDELEICLRAGVDAAAHAITSGPFDDQLHRAMGDEKLFYVVTLNLYDGFLNWTDDPNRMDDPFLRETLSAAEVGSMRNSAQIFQNEREYFARQGLGPILDHVRDAQRAGAILLTGTDTGNPFAFPGYGVHEELRLMVEAGVSTMDALAAASANAAFFLGEAHQWGSIIEGRSADLLILEGNPLDDISNTRRIAEVVQNGKVVDRARLR